ncbi:MAG: hypothetical protein R3192_08435, partial [Woeseiaceae bacterium]|nr:hypothetical protein [Woeseiaceae bacterium]
MGTDKVGGWLQVGANLGIILGLVLVGLQLKQNSDLLRIQLLYAESQSFINHERAMIGENGADAWARSLEAPRELTLSETRIMEAHLYALAEQWRASHLLHELGVLGEEWQNRIIEESVYYLGNPYGRAWWNVYSGTTPLPDELRALVQQQIDESPNYTLPYHMA